MPPPTTNMFQAERKTLLYPGSSRRGSPSHPEPDSIVTFTDPVTIGSRPAESARLNVTRGFEPKRKQVLPQRHRGKFKIFLDHLFLCVAVVILACHDPNSYVLLWKPYMPRRLTVSASPSSRPGQRLSHSKNARNRAASAASSFTSHSHNTRTDHPASRNVARFRSSRATFRASFAAHQSARTFGSTALRHAGSGWRCQKQPRTSMIFRRPESTISGVPGKSRRCSRNRYPIRNNNRRTRRSGVVCFPATAARFRRLASGTSSKLGLARDINPRLQTSATTASAILLSTATENGVPGLTNPPETRLDNSRS